MAFFSYFSPQMKRKPSTQHYFPFELVFWCVAMLGIICIQPEPAHHWSLCPLDLLGWDWCPGCGLGRSMNLLIRGDFAGSWAMHPLGGFAWGVIIFRIFELIKQLKTNYYYG